VLKKKLTLLACWGVGGACWVVLTLGTLTWPRVLPQAWIFWPCIVLMAGLIGAGLVIGLGTGQVLSFRPEKMRKGYWRLAMVAVALLPLMTWALRGYAFAYSAYESKAAIEQEAMLAAVTIKLYAEDPPPERAALLAGCYYRLTGVAVPFKQANGGYRLFTPAPEDETRWLETEAVQREYDETLDFYHAQALLNLRLAAAYALILFCVVMGGLALPALRKPKAHGATGGAAEGEQGS
jgi:hypothetical protein